MEWDNKQLYNEILFLLQFSSLRSSKYIQRKQRDGYKAHILDCASISEQEPAEVRNKSGDGIIVSRKV